MAKKFSNDVTSFWDRLQGQEKLKKSDSLIVLNSPETDRERTIKQRIQSISHYVRTKNWNRRHIEFFDEYRRMVATFPIIKAGIDIYAEEITCQDIQGNIFSIHSEHKAVKDELEYLFYKVLNINSKGYLIAREMAKFGNAYTYLVTRPKDGVTDLLFLPPEGIIREHMFDPYNLENYRYMWTSHGGSGIFEPWELVHWRNLEDVELEPYGVSILRSVVDTWRRVVLIREALVIYRITRAPSRYLFKIDTSGLTGEEALKFANEMKKSLEKKPLVNSKTGEIDFKWNPLSIEENLFMPTYEGSPADVQVLEGASNLDAVEDYKIIKDDLFAGLKIPKSFLSFEEDINSKSTLSEEDIRFAKTIQRLQREIVQGFVHTAIVHLYMKGFSQDEIQSFKIVMNNPSGISEKRKNELLQQRLDAAKSAWDPGNEGLNLLSYTETLKTILKLSDEEVKHIIKSQFNEKRIQWRLKQITNAGFYDEPENEKLLAKLKELQGNEKENPSTMGDLNFDSSMITEVIKKKIDQEILEMFPTVQDSASKGKIQTLVEGTMMKNIKKAKKDFR